MMMIVMIICETFVIIPRNIIYFPKKKNTEVHMVKNSFLDGALDSEECSYNSAL
jgi:hypothetical protein